MLPEAAAVMNGEAVGQTVGPMTLVLSDGQHLSVLPGTPGGNACLELMDARDRRRATGMDHPTDRQVRLYGGLEARCSISGTRIGKRVTSFQVRRHRAGTQLVDIGAVSGIDPSGRLAFSGLVFSVDRRVVVQCSDIAPGDIVHTVGRLMAQGRFLVGLVSAATQRVLEIDCLGTD
jgi:hypothetical protein